MEKKTKYQLGWSAWFGLGLFTMILGWEHFIIWVLSAYAYYAFVQEYAKSQKGVQK